jgi:hypothetical protein
MILRRGKIKIGFIIAIVALLNLIVLNILVDAYGRMVYADELSSPVETKDPKTQEMIDSIKKAGLSLHPAQHCETW